jgi:hypothetical protein
MCFHVASIVFSVRRITVTDVTIKRVYRYGKGKREAPIVDSHSLNGNLSPS